MSSDVFRAWFRVTWVDTDAAGVMHYSNFFRFFERAEEEFYRFLGFSFSDLKQKGLWFPRVEAFCQYKAPARFNDLVEVELTVEALKAKSVKFGFILTNAESGSLLAAGHLVVVAADKASGKAAQIPLDIVEKLKPFAKMVL